MRLKLAGMAVIGLIVLAGATPAMAQGVEMRQDTRPAPFFEIVPQSPATREATRPPDANFYGPDIRVRHEPAFIEPFVGKTEGGNEYGLSGWTTPQIPVGSLNSQASQQNNGWISFGLTFLFDYPPKPPARSTSAPR